MEEAANMLRKVDVATRWYEMAGAVLDFSAENAQPEAEKRRQSGCLNHYYDVVYLLVSKMLWNLGR